MKNDQHFQELKKDSKSQTKRVFQVSIYAFGLVFILLALSIFNILPYPVLIGKIVQLAVALNLLFLTIVIYQWSSKGLYGRSLVPVVLLIAGWLAVAVAVKLMQNGSILL
ncbi:hypothetical protein [Dyadobacter alkalitolerans]|uniref:hypothetical protein n=1 Tax=Dyadobacter alkalitolerans TaxID=492736 RepID=UPI00047C8F36|nr:hypothetical protein [Dyadobacter alkalitolerans]